MNKLHTRLLHILGLGTWLLCLSLPAAALERVVLQLPGFHQYQFAGYYAAQAQGYYREAGLEVSIEEARPGSDPLANVSAGQAQFGVADSQLLLARANGKPLVALASIFQHAPQVLFLAANAKDLKALSGKPVMFDSHDHVIQALLRQAGMDKQVKRVDPSFSVQDLIHGKVAAMAGSLLNEPYFLAQANFEQRLLKPQEAGIDFYGDTLYTTQAMVQEHGDMVRAFRLASLRGWQYALEHADEMSALIRGQYAPRLELDYLRHQARGLPSLISPDEQPLGSMSLERWQQIAQTYVALGLLPSAPDLTGFIFDPTPPTPAPAPEKDYRIWLAATGAGLLVLLFIIVSWRLARTQFALRLERQRQQALENQLRSNEERFRGLFTSMDNGFALNELICDSNGRAVDYRFIEVNPAYENVSGQPAAALTGKRASEVLGNVDAELLEQCAEVALQGKAKRFERYSQQTLRWFHTDAYSPERGKFAVVTQDITERKQMEIALTQAHAELREKYEEISALQEQLREQAIRDPLTGLHNRRYLDETLIRELSRARRESYPLCVILMDLDFFKKVNDTYGHLGGDETLKAFAKLMKQHCRQGDVACRYGGEEFMLMLPKMPIGAAVERANQLRELFAQTRIPFGDQFINTTLSIGIAYYPEHGEQPEQLTDHADQALYQAKKQGRNRVIAYAQGMTEDGHAPAATPSATPAATQPPAAHASAEREPAPPRTSDLPELPELPEFPE